MGGSLLLFRVFSFILLILPILSAKSLILGPMLGHVDDNSAQVWCALDEVGEITIHVSEREDLKNAKKVHLKPFERGIIRVDSLKEDTQYYYRVAAHRHSFSPRFKFKTTKRSYGKTKLRFLFTSCSGKTGYDSAPSWDDIKKIKAVDLIFMLGDNHYADTTEPELIRKSYFSHRAIASFREVTANIPTYGIWDDHDYGPNNSDGQTKGKEKSLATFREHWGNPSFGEADNPGVYTSFVRGDVQFILLDSRYHRTPNRSMKRDDPNKTLLGERQLKWLEKTLRASKAKFKVVACGSEFQKHGSSDGFSGFRVEQKKILNLFSEIEGVLLISGDRHFTGGYQIDGKTIEVTSGPLGSRSYSPKFIGDMFFLEAKAKLYSVYELDTSGKEPKAKLEVYKAGKGLVREFEFSWKQINGQEKVEISK